MRFTDIFIKRPVLATVVSLVILLIGSWAGQAADSAISRADQHHDHHHHHLSRGQCRPDQGFITTPIQQAVASAEGIDTLASSGQIVPTVTLNLRLNADPDRAMTDVLAKVNQLGDILPRESNRPVVVKQTGEGYALLYMSFNSDVMTSSQITDYLMRVVQPRLQTIDGVANAQILGGQTFAMRVWLDPERMAGLNITPNEVRAALAANNFTSAPGQIKGDFVKSRSTPDVAEKRPGLRSAGGRPAWRHADPPRQHRPHRARPGERGLSSVFDGLKAVFIGVYPTPTPTR